MMNQKKLSKIICACAIGYGLTFFGMGSALAETNNASCSIGSKGTIVTANRASHDLSLIDVCTDNVTNLVMPQSEAPSEPMYVVHRRGNVFVGDRANNRVVVFDAEDFSVVNQIPVGNGVFHMWARGKQLWVNNDIDNTISIINTRKMQVMHTLHLPAELIADGGRPHDVILDRKFAYVTMIGLSGETDAVIKYNRRNFKEVARADVGKDPHVTLAPNKGRLYVAAQDSNEVQVLKRSDLTNIETIHIPNAHGLDITRNGRIVYVTNIADNGMDAIFTLNARKNTLIGEPVATQFATPHNLVLTGNNRKLYVTHSGAVSDKVSVFSVSKRKPIPRPITEVTVGLNPFGIEFVPNPDY